MQTDKAKSIIRHCLERQMERLREDIKFPYTPDTVKPIRKMLRKELAKTEQVYYNLNSILCKQITTIHK